MSGRRAVAALALAALAAPAAAQSAPAARSDSAFHALQARGASVMGVDQRTTAHRFEDLPDGGRIVFEAGPGDTVAIAQIRRHLRAVAAQFAAGDFSAPRATHGMPVPGTALLAARRDRLAYLVQDRRFGAELRIQTTDPAALAAVHEFLAFQRADHRAPGADPAAHPHHH